MIKKISTKIFQINSWIKMKFYEFEFNLENKKCEYQMKLRILFWISSEFLKVSNKDHRNSYREKMSIKILQIN